MILWYLLNKKAKFILFDNKIHKFFAKIFIRPKYALHVIINARNAQQVEKIHVRVVIYLNIEFWMKIIDVFAKIVFMMTIH